MKKFFSTLVVAFSLFSLNTHAAWNIYQDYIIINSGAGNVYHAGGKNVEAAPTFNSRYYGNFTSLSTFILNGGENKTSKNGFSNVCAGTLFYRVYRTCDTPGSFLTVNLAYDSDLGGGNQKWDETAANINLLAGLTLSGTYILEAYWSAEGNLINPAGCGEFILDNNSSNNYKAYFDFDINESFTDSNFSASPVWSGDVTSWQVVQNSDVSTLNGSEIIKSRTLRLNVAAAIAGVQSISTPITNWDAQQEWSFWVGRRGQMATTANQFMFYLYSTVAALESPFVDGYRLVYGDDAGVDEIRLQYVTDGVATNILTSASGSANGITDFGFTVFVSRSQAGLWTLKTSAMPVANGTGPTANACPITASTVFQGSVTNTVHTPSGTGYLGVVGVHTSNAPPRVALEVDNIKLTPIPFNTFVNFDTSGATVNEVDGTITLTIDIANASIPNSTSVDVVLTIGNSARINGFTSQTVTFPANSSASEQVVITITDNALCDDFASLRFELQNATGGTNAYIALPSTFLLNINDDNMGYTTILNDDFEDNNITGWTSNPPAWWASSNIIPCSGSYSARSADVNVGGLSAFTYDTDDASLAGQTTTWRFNFRYFPEPTPSNKFVAFLAANESNLLGATVDGYAVGINPASLFAPDLITLWQVDNGILTIPIVTSAIDWGNGAAISEVGFEIIRDDMGGWTLKIDANGDFNNLVTIGSGTNTTYDVLRHFGVRYQFTAGFDNALAFDDITITQKGCISNYYSQGSGNVSDPIWDDVPIGVGGTIEPARYTSLVIQNGHGVTQNANLTTQNITIEPSGVLNAASFEHKTYGQWVNDGTYNAGSGTVTFKGDVNQNIDGLATTAFNNLKIDNDGSTVTALVAAEVTGVVSPDEGTLDANGNLTLISTSATQAASIGEIKSGADVIGDVTLERYIPSWTYNGVGWNSGGTWVNLGCPLNGTLTLADWNDDMVTTGFVDSDFPPPYTFVNIVSYDESVPGNQDLGYVNATDISNTLSGGYEVFLPYNAHDIDVTGTINKGALVQGVNYTNTGNGSEDGWNLLTNLYPSEIDFDPLAQNGFGATTYYVFDRDLPGYRSYNGITQIGTASRYIPHSQSFFVQSNPAAGGLQYNENYKSNTGSAFERSRPGNSFISLRIEKDGMADEAVINYTDLATPGYEKSFDALKLSNDFVIEAPELAIVAGEELLTIQSTIYAEGSIYVWVDAPSEGDYLLLINEIQNLPIGACVVLRDLQTNQSVVVENGSSIAFSIAEPFTGIRFEISSSASFEILATPASCYNAGNGQIVMSGNGSWEMNGADIYMAGTGNATIYNLTSGVYDFEIASVDICPSQTVTVEVLQPAELVVQMQTLPSSCNYDTGIIELNIDNGDVYFYSVVNSAGQLMASGNTADRSLHVDALGSDVYTVLIQTICEEKILVANLKDPNAVSAQINSSDLNVDLTAGNSTEVIFNAQAVNATSFEWTFSNGYTNSLSEFSYSFTSPGTYSISLHASNEYCSDTDIIGIQVTEANVVNETMNGFDATIIPSENGFEIQFGINNVDGVMVRVLNALGQLISTQEVSNPANSTMQMDMSQYPSGTYVVTISSASRILLSQEILR